MTSNDVLDAVYALSAVLGVCSILMFCFLYRWCKSRSVTVHPGKHIGYNDYGSFDKGRITERISELQNSLARERREKEELLNRLSRITSEKLRDGNPNIVDISDQNRPGKLGEQYSELYDNEWTDAFSVIEKEKGSRQAIEILLQILLRCYEMSKKEADDQIEMTREHLKSIVPQVSQGSKSAVDGILYRVKEERKLFAPNRVPRHEAVKQSLIQNGEIDESILNTEEVQKFLKECERICWLMVIQDPPMVLFYNPHHGNQDNFRAYLHRGEHLLYVVWPTVLQYEGGPLVFKGVAEYGDKAPTKSSSLYPSLYSSGDYN